MGAQFVVIIDVADDDFGVVAILNAANFDQSAVKLEALVEIEGGCAHTVFPDTLRIASG